MGLLFTSRTFCGGGAGEGVVRGEVCTPVETIPTRCGIGCCMVVLELCGLSFASEGFGFRRDVVLDTPAEDALDEGLIPGVDSTFDSGGDAKASSASAAVTHFVSVGSEVVGASPNSNFWPRSWSRENSSKDGKREASSSAAARLT